MVLNYLKNSALGLLTSDIPDNIERYNADTKWIDDYFEEKGIGNYYFNSMISVPDVELIIGDSKTDFENAVKLYSAFKDVLNPVQASDLRLWAYLAHNTYWEYMRARWAINIPADEDEAVAEANKLAARIGSRFFFKASKGKAFVRQGIARLYWSAYLTYDDKNSNPFEYTQYFLSKQDIFAVSTERSLARNKRMLLAALKVLKETEGLKREDIRQFFLRLNQAGGILVLDSLSENAAYNLSKRILEEVLVPQKAEAGIPLPDEDSSENEDTGTKIVVSDKSTVIAKNMKNNKTMPIIVSQKKIQTKPALIGLKVGDRFKIRNKTWEITGIQ